MVTKTKRVLAVILTGMMAATALAGCTQTTKTESGSGAGTASTASTADGGESKSEGDGGSGSTVDVYSDEMTANIKAKMKEEAAANGGTIELKVWCASADLKFEKTLIEEFKELYKSDDGSYEFKIRSSGAIGEPDAGGKIVESPKDGADVFNFADDQLSTLVEAKAIAPVIELFNSNVKANNTKETVDACTIDGTAYAFPKTSDNGYFLYYDKRVFKDDSAVASLDDMIKTAKDAGKNVYFNLGNAWYNAAFYFSAGVTIKYENGKQTTTFNTDEGLNAAKAMCHVAENAGAGFTGSDGGSGDNTAVEKGFNDGTLAAAVIGTWEGPAIKKAIGEENVGAAKLPTALIGDKQVQLESFGGYKLIGVNQFTKFPVTSQALAYYLGNTQSQLKRYAERGLIPTSNEALSDTKVQADPAKKAIEDQTPFSHGQGSSVSGKYWSTNVGGFGGEIVTKKGAFTDDQLKDSLAKIQEQIDT